MRTKHLIIGLWLVLGLACARAADMVSAIITVTNAPVAGDWLTVNLQTRYFVSTVTVPSTQVLAGASIAASTTNLYRQVASYPFWTLTVAWLDTNMIRLTGLPGQTVEVTNSGVASVLYQTNTVTYAYGVRVPMSVETSSMREYIASQLASDLSTSSTNAIVAGSTLASQLVGLTNTQTITGTKTLTAATVSGTITNAAIYGTTGYIAYVRLSNPIVTNLINYGNPIQSWHANGGQAFGYNANASNATALAIGNSMALGSSTIAIGSAEASAENAIAIGYDAVATGVDSGAIGSGTYSSFNNSMAIGYGSQTTTSNQVRLGNSDISVSVAKNLSTGNNLSIGNDWEQSFPTDLVGGLMLNNGTGPSVNPTNAAVVFAESGELKYRTSTTSEGASANNRVHNRGAEVVGSGGDYALSTSYSKVDFGGTDPELNTIPSAGTYLIQASIVVYDTTSADDIYATFWNFTDSLQIADSEVMIDGNAQRQQIFISTIQTFGAAKRIQIYAKNATASRGFVNSVQTKIWYIRLY